MTKRDKIVLLKILEEIRYLETLTASLTFDVFMNDETIKRAACVTLINVG